MYEYAKQKADKTQKVIKSIKPNTVQQQKPITYNSSWRTRSDTAIIRQNPDNVIQRAVIGKFTRRTETGIHTLSVHWNKSNAFHIFEGGELAGYLKYGFSREGTCAYLDRIESHLSGVGTLLIWYFANGVSGKGIDTIKIVMASLMGDAQVCYERAGFRPDEDYLQNKPEEFRDADFDGDAATPLKERKRKGKGWACLTAATADVIRNTQGILAGFEVVV